MKLVASWIGVVAFLGGCGGDPAQIPVSVKFQAVVGDEPFACGRTYMGVGSTSATMSPRDFRFYVHDVALLADDGSLNEVTLEQTPYQYQDVALLDFEDASGDCVDGDAEIHTEISGTVAEGTHVGLQFRLGVPFDLNHTALDTQPSPLNKSSLYWDWMIGHVFMAVATHVETPAVNDHFTHVGSTACQGDPANRVPVASCDRPNRVSYASGFNPAVNTVVADFKAIKDGVDITTGRGCHSFNQEDCSKMFENLGIDWSTGQDKSGQKMISVR